MSDELDRLRAALRANVPHPPAGGWGAGAGGGAGRLRRAPPRNQGPAASDGTCGGRRHVPAAESCHVDLASLSGPCRRCRRARGCRRRLVPDRLRLRGPASAVSPGLRPDRRGGCRGGSGRRAGRCAAGHRATGRGRRRGADRTGYRGADRGRQSRPEDMEAVVERAREQTVVASRERRSREGGAGPAGPRRAGRPRVRHARRSVRCGIRRGPRAGCPTRSCCLPWRGGMHSRPATPSRAATGSKRSMRTR